MDAHLPTEQHTFYSKASTAITSLKPTVEDQTVVLWLKNMPLISVESDRQKHDKHAREDTARDMRLSRVLSNISMEKLGVPLRVSPWYLVNIVTT